MAEFHRTEVDGIPVYWTPWDEQPHQAEIVFRVGTADETLALRGVTHLVEHLALFEFGQPLYHYNGTVQQKLTFFNATGRADEMREFIGKVTRSLAALPYERLAVEKRVLDVEEAGSGVGPSGRLKALRFGAASYGNVVKRELARALLDPDTLERWRTHWFTRGNAVIHMTGEPPDTFGIELPDGDRIPPPEPQPLRGLALPAVNVRSDAAVSLAVLAPRSDALQTVMYVAQRRLTDSLRHERGVVYSAERNIDILGRDTAHAVLSLDCLDEHAAFAATRLVEILRELADRGPTEDELEHEREGVRRSVEHRDAPLDAIEDAALDELFGVPVRRAAEWLAEVEALTPAGCARALADALPTAILDVSPEAGDVLPDGFRPYEVERPELPKPDGPEFREKDETDCPVRPCRYTLGSDHLHLQPGDGSDPTSIPYGDVAGVIAEAAAAIRIVTVDERRLEISRFKFIEGDALVDALRERIPAHLWLPPSDTMQAVDALAAEQLALPELVTEELQDLAHVLREDERPLALASDAQAGDDAKPGLVAVTTERLFFIWAEPSGDEAKDIWNETERADIESAEATTTDDGRPKLSFTIDGESFGLDGIESPGAVERLVAAIRAGSGGDRTGAPAAGVSSG